MKSIDQRIVEMGFDNKQFEDGIATSVKSLDKLKKSLDMKDSAKSLAELNKAGRNFSLEGIAAGVDKLSSKFSTLGIMGITTIQNLTNSALNAGKRMVEAFTIEPIRTGLEEYETKINAIQTILTNTESKGTTLKEVNDVLAELNEYSDQTIYNFAEMTRNIGTFTAAGIGLKDSAVAIKGIANLAAGSGSNAQQAATAMYQLSQALAAGSVKLMDWNSVVNAGMGGELFQNALKKTAKEMGIVVDSSVPFRESLQDGWITADVLISTLRKFATDKSLVLAATQVKTFTQMIGTMKESVQSGWAVTWENIIGNKDEAAKLFTMINDQFGKIASSAADSRNSMLGFWKEYGGRAALIEGVTSALKTFADVLTPIRTAFKDIFPPTTGSQLIGMSVAFRDLMENFKIGEETLDRIHRTFSGVFAIIDIGRILLGKLTFGFIDLLKSISPITSGFLSMTAGIGDSIVKFRDALKNSDSITKFVEKLKTLFEPALTSVKMTVQAIGDAMTALGNINTSGLDNLSRKLEVVFGPIIALGNIFMSAIEKVFPIVARGFDAFGTIVVKLFSRIASELKSLEFETIISILNGAFLMGLLSSLNKFIKSLTEVTGGGTKIVDNLKTILTGVGGVLESYQKNLQAKTLFVIASSIAMLAASLVALSMIDPARLTSSLEAISILFAQMFIASGAFGKVLAASKALSAAKAVVTINGLATAIILLSVAMEKLSNLSWEGLAKGVISIQILMTMLTNSANSFEKSSLYLARSAVGILAFAATINILAEAVEKLGKLDIATLAKGLISVGILMTELGIFMKLTTSSKMAMSSAVGLLILAGALNAMVIAVEGLGNLKIEVIQKGLITLGLLLTELSVFMNTTMDVKHVISTAVGLTILSTALLLFSVSISKLGSLSLQEISKGLLAMAGTLVIVAGAMSLMPGNMILSGIGLNAVAVAINVLALALGQLSGLSLGEIAKSLIALGGGLAIIAVAMTAMAGGIPGAIAMSIMAGALALFIPVLGLLSSIPWQGIAVGLGAIAGAFIIIGVASAVLSPMTVAILGLGAALTVLGVGLLAIGGGVTLFSTGLALLANSVGLFVTSVIDSGTDLLKTIPNMMKFFTEFLKGIPKVLKDSVPAFVESVVTLIDALLKALTISVPNIVGVFVKLVIDILAQLDAAIPKVMELGLNIVVSFLKGIASKVPDIIMAATDIMIKFLKGVRDSISSVVAVGIEIIVNFIKGVATMLPKVIQSAFDLMISFINGLAEAIRTNSKTLLDAIFNLMSAVVETAISTVTTSISKFSDIGEYVVDGFIGGIKSKFEDIKLWAGKIASTAIDTAKEVLGIHSPSKVFQDDIGFMVGEGMAKGVEKSTPKVVTATKKMSKSSFEAAKEWIDERKYYNKLTLKEEYEAWKNIQKNIAKGNEQQKEAAREVYRLKTELGRKEFDNSVEWINDKKYYNKLSLAEELAAWKRVQSRYLAGSDERKQADREVYRVQQELNEKRKTLEDNYADKVKDINDKLSDQVTELNDRYNEAFKSRVQALYDAYGLFDEIEKKDPINGAKLISNLEGQVKEFEAWQKNIKELSTKGLDSELMKELTDMGPKSAAEIEALNKMSADELTKYAGLWKQKYADAKTQASIELADMRIDTLNQIMKLTYASQIELRNLKTVFDNEISDLVTITTNQMSNMQETVTTQVSELTATTTTKLTKMVEDVKAIDWKSLGETIIKGITSGVEAKAKEMTDAVIKAATDALTAAKKAISDNAPVIKPVLDLSNIESGSKTLSSLLAQNGGISTSTISANLPSIASKSAATSTKTDTSTTTKPSTSINYTFNSPKALDSVAVSQTIRRESQQLQLLLSAEA